MLQAARQELAPPQGRIILLNQGGLDSTSLPISETP
jgi:hypothetical protein